jgi:hypothetical protein
MYRVFTVCRHSIPKRIWAYQKWEEQDNRDREPGVRALRGSMVPVGSANGCLEPSVQIAIEERIARVDAEYELDDEIEAHRSPLPAALRTQSGGQEATGSVLGHGGVFSHIAASLLFALIFYSQPLIWQPTMDTHSTHLMLMVWPQRLGSNSH